MEIDYTLSYNNKLNVILSNAFFFKTAQTFNQINHCEQ
jgi:hypothetical protein